jgi:hypothetical protein
VLDLQRLFNKVEPLVDDLEDPHHPGNLPQLQAVPGHALESR